MASERLPSRPACLLVASGATEGVSAQSFLHCFTLASAAFNLQVATPGGKAMDFVDVTESSARWVQDFRLKAYASPAKLESIDGARYHALLIPSCPGALADLASSGSLARILQHFHSESKPICAVGHGVAALCCATSEDRSWVFRGYSLTGALWRALSPEAGSPLCRLLCPLTAWDEDGDSTAFACAKWC
ncbi:glutamine amidotransferase-like class 1 domain-containing protein 1 isoform X6 [Cynocephalus volans]|uniref:glutamine amidotransferase-like class 1 domain-containing protein 1 isoform X6 n=1 Tax=Cynocephalus volans TaxID=110931 RepID=UPI002FCA2AF7